VVAPRETLSVVRIGTRGGALALWQAAEVARILRLFYPSLIVEQQIIRTTGDRVHGLPLAQIGGKGLFTKELEEALASESIDIAVHSLKDLPTSLPDGLALGAVLKRDDPRDVLVAAPGTTLGGLPAGARVGTSSLRRRAQLLACNPRLALLDVRGNVATRLSKLDRGEFDALVLAWAGLHRLGLDDRIAEVLEPDLMVPAVGQGALAVEVRAADVRVATLVQALDHRPTRLATCAERAFLARLEGGCQVPIGALGTWQGASLTLVGIVTDVQGERSARGAEEGVVVTEGEAVGMGGRLADRLLDLGAGDILEQVRAAVRAKDTTRRDGS
jgi:hydroxymethylbilane synthase